MKTQYVYFLKGLPASGKSTWAKEKIEEDRHKGIITKRINKDDLRSMLDNSIHSKEREQFILKVRDSLISLALVNGYDVIVDDTNFHEKHLKKIQEIVNSVNYNMGLSIKIEQKFFNTPLLECIERDKNRTNSVGEEVIRRMYSQYLKKENSIMPHNPNLPYCIVVDVDGTLALKGDRSPYDYANAIHDKLNKPIAELLSAMQYSLGIDYTLETFIMTGRENIPMNTGDVKKLTTDWLYKHEIIYSDIFIREYKDHRPDWQVKEDLYRKHIEGRYNVLYWIDDRKQVIDHIRNLGITVLDVAGNSF